jgi:hypothetical protein
MIRVVTFWVMTLCNLVDVCQHFGGKYWHLLQFRNDNVRCFSPSPSSRILGAYRAEIDPRLEAGCIIYVAIRINTLNHKSFTTIFMFEASFEHTKNGLSTESFPREIYFKSFCLRFSICKQDIYFESDDSHFFLNDLGPQATPAHESLSVIAL